MGALTRRNDVETNHQLNDMCQNNAVDDHNYCLSQYHLEREKEDSIAHALQFAFMVAVIYSARLCKRALERSSDNGRWLLKKISIDSW